MKNLAVTVFIVTTLVYWGGFYMGTYYSKTQAADAQEQINE